jgi:microcystin-dependent protein
MEPFLGMIIVFPYNFPPRGWAFCQGQVLLIAQNTALFSLIGTTYGGDGQTTFALPDLRGRTVLSGGQGPGLSTYTLGQHSGQETVTLTLNQIPSHSHTGNVKVGSGLANSATGAGNNFAANTGGTSIYNSGAAGDNMAANVITNITGGSQAHNNMIPYLVLNYCIAMEGIYPSRN